MRIRLGIQAKLILTLSLLTGLILGLATWIYYQRAYEALDQELGDRLISIGRIVAADMDVARGLRFEPGEETQGTYRSFQETLRRDADELQLKNIYLINAQGETILDARGEVSLGIPISKQILPESTFQKLSRGETVITPIYREELGRLFKSAFIPLDNPQRSNAKPVAYLRVDANPNFLASVTKIQQGIAASALATIPLSILVAAIFAFTLLSPIRKLTGVAQQIAEGDRTIAANIRGRDELATLGQAFDHMTAALREKEEYLQVLRKEAEERAEYMKIMAGVVAHEVRNPLAATQGFLELLLRKTPPGSPEEEYARAAHAELQRLHHFVDSFLRFARPPDLKIELANFAETVRSVLTLVEPEALKKAVKLELSAPPHVTQASFDPAQIRDAILNLCRNAVEAAPPKSLVRVRTWQDAGDAYFSVTDQGAGITPEHQGKIFVPFFTTKAQGTGLGLPTVRRVVEAHGGSIQVESTPGKGTSFTIKLPIQHG